MCEISPGLSIIIPQSSELKCIRPGERSAGRFLQEDRVQLLTDSHTLLSILAIASLRVTSCPLTKFLSDTDGLIVDIIICLGGTTRHMLAALLFDD